MEKWKKEYKTNRDKYRHLDKLYLRLDEIKDIFEWGEKVKAEIEKKMNDTYFYDEISVLSEESIKEIESIIKKSKYKEKIACVSTAKHTGSILYDLWKGKEDE